MNQQNFLSSLHGSLLSRRILDPSDPLQDLPSGSGLEGGLGLFWREGWRLSTWWWEVMGSQRIRVFTIRHVDAQLVPVTSESFLPAGSSPSTEWATLPPPVRIKTQRARGSSLPCPCRVGSPLSFSSLLSPPTRHHLLASANLVQLFVFCECDGAGDFSPPFYAISSPPEHLLHHCSATFNSSVQISCKHPKQTRHTHTLPDRDGNSRTHTSCSTRQQPTNTSKNGNVGANRCNEKLLMGLSTP